MTVTHSNGTGPSGTIGVEPFDAAYGAGFQADDESPHALECELIEDAGGSKPTAPTRPTGRTVWRSWTGRCGPRRA